MGKMRYHQQDYQFELSRREQQQQELPRYATYAEVYDRYLRIGQTIHTKQGIIDYADRFQPEGQALESRSPNYVRYTQEIIDLTTLCEQIAFDLYTTEELWVTEFEKQFDNPSRQ